MTASSAPARRNMTRSLVLTALMAALTAICSQIQIPLPMIPINLALFAVHLSGALLGWKYGALSMVVYALLGVIFVLRADGGLQAALQLILRLVLLTLSVRMLSPAPANARLRPYAAAVCLLAGLVRVQLPFGVPLAVIPAAAICVLAAAGPEALAVGAACGLVLDLGSVPSPPQTACFCFSLLACRLAAGRKLARAAVFSGMYFLCVLVRGGGRAARARGAGESGASGAADGPGPDL